MTQVRDMATSAVRLADQKQSGQGVFRPEEIEVLVKTNIIPRDTPSEVVSLFAQYCGRSALSPFRKEVHLVPRRSDGQTQYTIQTGIDGYRKIAHATGELAGIDDAVFVEGDGPYPVSATVTVYRMVGGQRCAFTATARWREYFPSSEKMQFMWKRMPYGQLAKCAEALALRKGFSPEIEQVRTDDEMHQAEPPTAERLDPAKAVEPGVANTAPPESLFTGNAKKLFDESGKILPLQPGEAVVYTPSPAGPQGEAFIVPEKGGAVVDPLKVRDNFISRIKEAAKPEAVAHIVTASTGSKHLTPDLLSEIAAVGAARVAALTDEAVVKKGRMGSKEFAAESLKKTKRLLNEIGLANNISVLSFKKKKADEFLASGEILQEHADTLQAAVSARLEELKKK